MKIKICGLRREEDIIMANKYLPDFIGFIFYKQSKRYISSETASVLKSHLDSRIKAVGVFVNEDINIIKTICDENIIDVIQLHGSETNEYIEQVKKLCKKPVIKAVRVKTSEEIIIAKELNADYLLLDTYNDNEYGGSGKTFDHKLIPDISKPFFLAGGLNKSNISATTKICKPYAIDVSSGCETNGYKDELKFQEIVLLSHKLLET